MKDSRFDRYPTPETYRKELTLKRDKTLGYLYFLDRGHPLASPGVGRVYYHRHVASIKIGRWVTSHEHVHHEDENKLNNDHSNLEILTPSEHGKRHNPPQVYTKTCPPPCSTFFDTTSSRRTFCSASCAKKAQRKFEVSKEDLHRMVWAHPTTHIAKMLGVSDVAVAKRCKKLGVDKPPRGYWSSRPRSSTG